MNLQSLGVGPTRELSLRASIAALARVVFPGPVGGELMLVLEHKATLLPGAGEPRVVVKAQPLGGAVRIVNFDRLLAIVDSFHFDSERSRSEGDFRLFIRPTDWPSVREFCLDEFKRGPNRDLESDPARELIEEFDDALGIVLDQDQFSVRPVNILLEDKPTASNNVRAAGRHTVRVYRIFEARILDPDLAQVIVANSEAHPPDVLEQLALDDARQGGRGRANALFAAPMERIRAAYLALTEEKRAVPLHFENTILDDNVPAVLEGIPVPKFHVA